jgi:hypothetical protein
MRHCTSLGLSINTMHDLILSHETAPLIAGLEIRNAFKHVLKNINFDGDTDQI